jgi:thiol-disulfide isomerase/thioredoxin
MKKNLLFFVFLIASFNAIAQKDSINLAPYLRFPTIPPLRLLLTDSTTLFTKDDLKNKKPLLIILFSPDCEHCKHETEELIKNKEQLKKIQIVMATTQSFEKMKQFYDNYELGNIKNLVVGQDIYFILPSFYHIKNFPYNAMYDKKENLITTSEGVMPIEKIISTFK